MKNRFVVTTCRFHTKEKNKLLIMGWFWENQVNDNRISIVLGKKSCLYGRRKRCGYR